MSTTLFRNIIIIIFIIAVTYIIASVMYKKEIHRIEDNTEQLMSASINKELKLNREEFKNYINGLDTSLKRILKENKIKEKEITRIIETEYFNHYDTVLKLRIDTIKTKYKFFEYRPDSCNYLKIRVDIDSAYIDTFNINSKVYILHWVKRLNKNDKKVIWPFGKKKIIIKGFTNCSKNVETIEIEVNNNKQRNN